MRTFLALFIALPLWAWAQEPQNALLWRIISGEGGSPSYLLGTVHSRDARAYTAIQLAQAAMTATGAVFGELDMDATGQAKSTLASHAMMTGGQSLKDLYSPRRYKRVEKALRAKVGPLFMMLTHMKPILLCAMLTEESMGKDSSLVLDDYLQTRAKELGLRTGGIETIAEQLAAMDALPLKEQADLLYETVRANGHDRDMDRLLDAYAKQDLVAIAALMKDGGMSATFSRSLLTDRNSVMAQRIDSLMMDAPALFAIGAAHLPGEDGVLALLRGKGHLVAPVDTASMPDAGGLDIPAPELPPPPPTASEIERNGSLPRPPPPLIVPK